MSEIKLPETKHVLLEVPKPFVLLVTINREKQMNALTIEACWEMDRVWKWMDQCDDMYDLASPSRHFLHPSANIPHHLPFKSTNKIPSTTKHHATPTTPQTKPPPLTPRSRIAVLTGRGPHAFSSGMDLKERLTFTSSTPAHLTSFPPTGFGGLTRRTGLKPIIAAINGHAHGGGFELALNADIVLAAPHATFRLPDVLRGTAALQGALPRVVRTLGMQRAGLVALSGYTVSAAEAAEWGLVARVVEDVVGEAVEMAGRIAVECSPDSVVATRAGLREAWETGSVERATQLTGERWGESVFGGWNMREGLSAFLERRKPRWRGLGGKSLL